MKNILFIGPYRQRDPMGLWSQALAHNIINSTSHKVQLRPIFLDEKCAVSNIHQNLASAEQTIIAGKYDTVIQNVPTEHAVHLPNISKNILIPIIGSEILTEDQTTTVSMFDAVWIDNKHDSVKLNSISVGRKIKNIENIDYIYNIRSNSNAIFNIGHLAYSTKLYYIGQYRHNLKFIQDLVISFISQIKQNEVVLVLFTLDITPADKTTLENFIQQAYQALSMPQSIRRVVVAPITSDTSNIYTAHRSGDIYIDHTDKGSNSINTKIAECLKKPVIRFGTSYEFSLTDETNAISGTGSIKLSCQDIHNNIGHYLKNSTVPDHKILFKTKDISRCLQ